ncbi:universal stress protein [Phaeacidiphilus oryzae]|uniref:universal stress protein n=1 Tax=Phaeacidiphilus oryzae TaxID=348818 RepID=UPI00056D41B5|nr:universal stress protein [Phaeacidiphilus oryzae]
MSDPQSSDPASAPTGGSAETALPVSALPPVGADHPSGVVCALDGSDGSLWALDRAFSEAVAYGRPLYVVSAVDPAPDGFVPGMAEIVQESVDRLLAGMREVALRGIAQVRANRAGRGEEAEPPISLHVLQGSVIETLLSCCTGQHTLVVGTRGNGGFIRLLLGSVSTALVHHADCPVLVVPAPPAPAASAAPGAQAADRPPLSS